MNVLPKIQNQQGAVDLRLHVVDSYPMCATVKHCTHAMWVVCTCAGLVSLCTTIGRMENPVNRSLCHFKLILIRSGLLILYVLTPIDI